MRRGRLIGGIALLLMAGALSAPYAFAAAGSAVDEGYPCATTPPAAGAGGTTSGNTGGMGQCTTTTTTTVTTTTTQTVTTPLAVPASTTPRSGVAGASHTVSHSAANAAPAAVAPAAATHTSGTLPFTGAQLTMFVVIGVLLIGGGLVLRASGRSRSER